MNGKRSILLADDHTVVRQGIALIVKEAIKDIEVFHADSFDKALELATQVKPDMVLLDINLPGGNTITMISRLMHAEPGIKVLMFSAYDEEQYALRYIHAGAKGYLNKMSSESEIIKAIQAILNGGTYISQQVKEKIVANALGTALSNPLDALSDRELEIAGLLAKGEGNLEISNRLNLRMSTVSTYKARIFEKLGVNNVVSLVEKYRLYKE